MIAFGTSGWRSIIAEDFTFANVRKVVQAIADHLNSGPAEGGGRGERFSSSSSSAVVGGGPLSGVRGSPPATAGNDKRKGVAPRQPVVVGYDTRFLSPEFAKTAADVLSQNGIPVLFSKDFVPTPVVSFQIIQQKAAGGVNFTASHNPAEYNGIKFNMANGAPASPEVTHDIERLANERGEEGVGRGAEGALSSSSSAAAPLSSSSAGVGGGPLTDVRGSPPAAAGNDIFGGGAGTDHGKHAATIRSFDPRPAYLARLRKTIDVSALKKAKMRVGVDVLYGTGRGYLDEFFKEAGCKPVVLHNWRDVSFGGHSPEPAAEQLSELVRTMRKEKLVAGFGTDGDADRFGVVDQDGTLLSPNEILPIVLQHLVKTRGWKGLVVRSVMTSHFIDAVAKRYGLPLKETPVGFKYIAEAMEAGGFLMGGEESGGVTIQGHVPEKDGILACLLMAEVRAVEKKPFKKILQELRREVGPYYSNRINFHLSPEAMQDLRRRLETLTPNSLDGLAVQKIVRIDGFKFIFQDQSWLGIRLSGTEPVVRLYLEGDSERKLKQLETTGTKLIQG